MNTIVKSEDDNKKQPNMPTYTLFSGGIIYTVTAKAMGLKLNIGWI